MSVYVCASRGTGSPSSCAPTERARGPVDTLGVAL